MSNQIEATAAAATQQLAQLKTDFDASPEQRATRARSEQERLASDPHFQNKLLTSNGAKNDVAWLEQQVTVAERDAEALIAAQAASEEKRIDQAIAGQIDHLGAQVTVGSQIPARDLAVAVDTLLIEHGVRPTLIESFLKHGRGDHAKESVEHEQACAAEWERRLLADPEKQRRFLARDPEIMAQFAAFAMYRRDPRRG